MICGECGLEIGVNSEDYFYEICVRCGKILCLKCVRANRHFVYTCMECVVNR